LIFILYV
jgi:hypothetical protein